MAVTRVLLLLFVACTTEATDTKTNAGGPVADHPADHSAGGPVADHPATTDAPCTTVGPPATCATSTGSCPTGQVPKPDMANIACAAAKCTQADCCMAAPTSAPVTPKPTPAPTPAPILIPQTTMIVPKGCEARIPEGGFQPWEVYKQLKASTSKISTPPAGIAGSQILTVNNLNAQASAFTCQKANNEWRTVVDTTNHVRPSTISLSDMTDVGVVKSRCTLASISMYVSEAGIPGMRLDYACSVGRHKAATVLIGLRKVPDGIGRTPGLGKFFKRVCENSTNVTNDETLAFDLIDSMSMTGASFAKSADMLVMESAKDCFESGVVYTFLDENSNLPVFPVTDSEWDYFVINLPRSKNGLCTGGGPIPKQAPCAEQVTAPPQTCFHPKVYGHVIADRVCLHFADSYMDGRVDKNDCHPSCGPPNFSEKVKIHTTFTPPQTKPCATCYDCEGDDVVYAILGTWLTFFLSMNFYRRLNPEKKKELVIIENPSQKGFLGIGGDKVDKYYAKSMNNRNCGSSCLSFTDICDVYGPATKFGAMVLAFTCIVYFVILNIVNYLVTVLGMRKEMCLKLWSWQTNVDGHWNIGGLPMADMWNATTDSWSNMEHWSAAHGNRRYVCYNEACPGRILPLILITWLCMVALFIFTVKDVEIEGTTKNVESKQVEVEKGVGGGTELGVAGTPGRTLCTVQ